MPELPGAFAERCRHGERSGLRINAGYYDASRTNATGSGAPLCVPCPVGAFCERPGVSLWQLPLEEGFWRQSQSSAAVLRCPDEDNRAGSGCTGGVDALCKPWLAGPYCTYCNVSVADEGGTQGGPRRYYSADESACLACSNSTHGLMNAAAAACLVTPLLVALSCVWLRRRALKRKERRTSWRPQRGASQLDPDNPLEVDMGAEGADEAAAAADAAQAADARGERAVAVLRKLWAISTALSLRASSRRCWASTRSPHASRRSTWSRCLTASSGCSHSLSSST